MGALDTDALLGGWRKPWSPLLRMQKTDDVAKKLGIATFWGRFAFSQLTYMEMPFSDLGQLATRIQAERLNWDTAYAQDMAALLSILVTNNIRCDSWEVFDRLSDIYRRGWRQRFLISLFCEGTSRKGYYGYPLYFSELTGYSSRGVYQRGMLDVMEQGGLDAAFDWMHRRMIMKLKDPAFRRAVEKEYDSCDRIRVYPYLVFGSIGWAAYDQLEKRGGMASLIRPTVPEDARREVYIMALCCLSDYCYHKREEWDGLFSQACRTGIRGLLHAGANASIEASPLFAWLQSEIGHLMANQFTGGKAEGTLVGELMDAMKRNFHVTLAGLGKAEEELDFSNVRPESPEDMRECVEKDLRELPTLRAKATYHVNQDWLKKLREM